MISSDLVMGNRIGVENRLCGRIEIKLKCAGMKGFLQCYRCFLGRVVDTDNSCIETCCRKKSEEKVVWSCYNMVI